MKSGCQAYGLSGNCECKKDGRLLVCVVFLFLRLFATILGVLVTVHYFE